MLHCHCEASIKNSFQGSTKLIWNSTPILFTSTFAAKNVLKLTAVGEHSKCTMTQVQFEAGQTEALLTMTTVREHSGRFYSSTVLLYAKWLQRPNSYSVSKKREVVTWLLKKPGIHPWERWTPPNNSQANKDKYPCLGEMGSISCLLTATVHTVERWLLEGL